MTTKPKAILFDLFTALADSWTIWDLSVPEAERHISTGFNWRKHYIELTYSSGVYKPYESLVRQAAKDVGLSEAAPERLLQNWDKITLFPETPDVLARLRETGFKLGIVTNCSKELGYRTVGNCEKTMRESTGGEFSFDVVITAEESGYYKPEPKPYKDALEKLRMRPEEVLFVAGSSSDIPGASGVGMKVVWHNKAGLERKGDVLPMREGKTLDEALRDVLTAKA
jgi:2-haloacid dehalogenase